MPFYHNISTLVPKKPHLSQHYCFSFFKFPASTLTPTKLLHSWSLVALTTLVAISAGFTYVNVDQYHYFLLYHFSNEVVFNIHVLGLFMMLRFLQEMDCIHIVIVYIHHTLLKPQLLNYPYKPSRFFHNFNYYYIFSFC